MRGWFDLFRENGGPTLYMHSNRTSVIGDVPTITLVIAFVTLYLAFFIIFPGVRKERFTTFLSVTLSLFVGSSVLLGLTGSSWHTAETEIASAYRAFSSEKIMGHVGVYMGLSHVNITLAAMPTYYNKTMDINFNERVRWLSPTELQEEYRAALIKGLPFPILTVIEYLAVDAEGFCWGRNYREAGYFTTITLWTSFIMWLCMNILLVVVPRYGAYMMTSTGVMMLLANAIYYWLLPMKPLHIHIEAAELHFELGWCFWLVLVAGFICIFVGGAVSIIDLIYPHKFSTILEMDYGTPFDRHTIIKDSQTTKETKKNVPKKLEEPPTWNGLWRRLSKRDGHRDGDESHPSGRGHRGRDGEVNYGYELDAPKSPWRYPHLSLRGDSRKHKSVSFKKKGQLELPMGASAVDPHLDQLRRTDSKDSNCSSLSSVTSSNRDAISIVVPQIQDPLRRFRRTDSSESSNSSLASFGALPSFLSRGSSSSRKAGAVSRAGNVQLLSHAPVERTASGQSTVSRGYIAPQPLQVQADVQAGDAPDDVRVIVSGRKDSSTTAVRRNSAEHQRSEAAMW